jgi:hypothetical protein
MPTLGSLFTMSNLRSRINLLLLGLQMASISSCIFLNKQNYGPGAQRLEEGCGRRISFNASLAGMSSQPDPFSFTKRDTCLNGVIQCDGYTCDECESCCGAYNPPATPCNSFAFGVCCTDGDSCIDGSECWYQTSGTRMGCCPPGLTGCFTTSFTCCFPGATCGASGCVGVA